MLDSATEQPTIPHVYDAERIQEIYSELVVPLSRAEFALSRFDRTQALKVAVQLSMLHWRAAALMRQIHEICGVEAELPYLNSDLRLLAGFNYKYLASSRREAAAHAAHAAHAAAVDALR
jgi:hypothetical protein